MFTDIDYTFLGQGNNILNLGGVPLKNLFHSDRYNGINMNNSLFDEHIKLTMHIHGKLQMLYLPLYYT